MVGITIEVNENPSVVFNTTKLTRSCVINNIYSNKDVKIISVEYEKYPIKIIKNESYIAVLEGIIYNYEDQLIESFLENINLSLFGSNKQIINKFIDKADGEFIIYIYFKKEKRIIIVNDRLGRLPLYYSNNEKEFRI